MKILCLLILLSSLCSCSATTDPENNYQVVYRSRMGGGFRGVYCICFPQPKNTPCYYFTAPAQGGFTQAIGDDLKPIHCTITIH